METQIFSPKTPTSSHRFPSALSLLNLFPSPPTTTHPQTFLYSPSPTATSFHIDSPVLSPDHLDTTYRTSVLEINSPTGLHRETFLYSPSEHTLHSPLSRWASSPTAVEGPSPLLTTYRVSDARAGERDTDFEDDSDDCTAGWGVVTAHEQLQGDADTEPLVAAPELELPYIGEDDFSYYPGAAELPYTVEAEKDEKSGKGTLRRVRRKLCKKAGSKEFSLRKWIKKGLVRMMPRRCA